MSLSPDKTASAGRHFEEVGKSPSPSFSEKNEKQGQEAASSTPTSSTPMESEQDDRVSIAAEADSSPTPTEEQNDKIFDAATAESSPEPSTAQTTPKSVSRSEHSISPQPSSELLDTPAWMNHPLRVRLRRDKKIPNLLRTTISGINPTLGTVLPDILTFALGKHPRPGTSNTSKLEFPGDHLEDVKFWLVRHGISADLIHCHCDGDLVPMARGSPRGLAGHWRPRP